jgi:metallophosphoesterase (TIGR03767 family)
VDATLRTVNALRGPATGQPPALAVTTGDAIDNAQWNEVQAFLALFDGGQVTPGSGGPGYHGIQAVDWPDDIFWKPGGAGPDGPDFFRRELGFPHHPGLLEAAMREFTAGGLDMPWLSCFGNHEALNQGVGTQTPALAAALTGGRKPVGLPGGYDADQALELFTVRPEAFMAGPSRAVPADPGRRPVTRGEFVAAHFRPGARPLGHGFTDENLRNGTAYYVHDTAAARLIALDTNCLAGGADGCLDRQQARWLEARLAEVHSAHRGPGGQEIRTGQDDRLVILFSHHGIDTLTNTRGWHPGPGGEPLIGAAELTTLLHRFPNVVLWLNGHTHVNAVRPRPDPDQPGRGFWEVTTCAVVDWPCQTRLVELAERDGQLSITCTMVDHDTPLGPPPSQAGLGGGTAARFSPGDLAALHRELAANIPSVGGFAGGTGAAADRNVELLISPPFLVGRLPGA